MVEAEVVNQIFAGNLVPPDGVLMVHSGFRELSRAGCRAETFIEQLISLVPEGTLLMPTFTWRTVTPENNTFDELKTPSITGSLTEVFRTQYASHRSLHPTHSTCALGPDAEGLLGEHHLEPNPCSSRSPFARLVDTDAHILLLGVTLDSCTLIHVGEELVAPNIYMRPAIESYECTDRHGVTHIVRTRRHQRLNRQFTKFERPLIARKLLQSGVLHKTDWQLFRAVDLHAQVLKALEVDLHGTLETAISTA